MHPFPHYRLVVLTKSPELGKAKTRLQPAYSAKFSQTLHIQLVDYVLTQWVRSNICPVDLWLSGDLSCFQNAMPHWHHLSMHFQEGNDLGERMQFAVKESLSHAKGVILVGTDCPFINSDYVMQACEALECFDVVMGPAADGGYVLLGLKTENDTIFADINWGTASVYTETRKKIEQQGLSCFTLPELNDIDRPDDLALLSDLHHFDDVLSSETS